MNPAEREALHSQEQKTMLNRLAGRKAKKIRDDYPIGSLLLILKPFGLVEEGVEDPSGTYANVTAARLAFEGYQKAFHVGKTLVMVSIDVLYTDLDEPGPAPEYKITFAFPENGRVYRYSGHYIDWFPDYFEKIG